MIFEEAVKRIITDRGIQFLKNADECESLLLDYTKDDPSLTEEARIFSQALDAGCFAALSESDDGESTAESLIRNFQNKYSINQEDAEWAIELLASLIDESRIEKLEEAARNGDDNARYDLALLLAKMKRFEEACRWFKELAENLLKQPPASGLASSISQSAKTAAPAGAFGFDEIRAIRVLTEEEKKEEAKQFGMVCYSQGQVEFNNKNFETAKTLFEKALNYFKILKKKTFISSLENKITQCNEKLASQTSASALVPRKNPLADFALIPAGTFLMGSPLFEPHRDGDEVQHTVMVSSFYMGKSAVTQKEWSGVMGTNPSHFEGDNLPVENVSWYDVIQYCNKRSIKEGLSPAYRIDKTRNDPNNKSVFLDSVKWVVTWDRGANGYRLPTETEWEYACRAGTSTPYHSGNSVEDAGWYVRTSKGGTRPVRQKQANLWGLYDMHGNVWEWCWDWYGAYPSNLQADPIGAISGASRVLRGGSWRSRWRDLRSANRDNGAPSNRFNFLGFRLVRPGM
jgi:formylglycine-generating enzyme required for sulfatase activity